MWGNSNKAGCNFMWGKWGLIKNRTFEQRLGIGEKLAWDGFERINIEAGGYKTESNQ